MHEILPELFASRLRAAVLAHMLPRPHLSFTLTDLARILGLPISSLQHECYKLQRIGVLTGRRAGNAYRYRPDPACPVLGPLTRLVAAGIGEATALRATLDGVSGLHLAFLASALPLAVAASADGSPAPLILVGELPIDAIDAVQERAAVILGVPLERVEAVFYRPDDWSARRREGSAYVASLLDGPRIDLVGDVAAGAVG